MSTIWRGIRRTCSLFHPFSLRQNSQIFFAANHTQRNVACLNFGRVGAGVLPGGAFEGHSLSFIPSQSIDRYILIPLRTQAQAKKTHTISIALSPCRECHSSRCRSTTWKGIRRACSRCAWVRGTSFSRARSTRPCGCETLEPQPSRFDRAGVEPSNPNLHILKPILV